MLAAIGRHKLLAFALPVTVAIAAGLSLWAVSYDRQASERLMAGTVIEGVPVGGLTHEAAVRRLRGRLEAPLRQPIRVEAERFDRQTSAWDLGYRIDTDKAVRAALRQSNGGNLFTRLWRRAFHTGSPPQLSLKPSWVTGDVDVLLGEASQAVTEAAKDADIDLSTGWVQIVPARAGRVLDVAPSKQALIQAVEGGADSARLVTQPTQPAETLQHVILVRAGENQLYLYRDGTIVKSWPVATGSGSYPSPPGVWRIVQKLVNPVWINPGSKWARGMPARIGPGPRNPLGTRALALNAPGILIHATSDTGSIGYSVSHGCIRMTEEHEKELFDMVPVGTRVAIVQAAPPKPRGARVPLPPAPTPVDTAVVEF